VRPKNKILSSRRSCSKAILLGKQFIDLARLLCVVDSGISGIVGGEICDCGFMAGNRSQDG